MEEKPQILDPRETKVQIFVTNLLQQKDLIKSLIEYTGPCFLVCSTYNTSEEFLRYVIRLKNKQLIKKAILIADLKAHTWNKRLQDLMFSTFDEVRLCSNHSKVMVMQGENYSVTTLCSQNQSRGERLENFTIIGGEDTAENVKQTLLNYPTFICQTNS